MLLLLLDAPPVCPLPYSRVFQHVRSPTTVPVTWVKKVERGTRARARNREWRGHLARRHSRFLHLSSFSSFSSFSSSPSAPSHSLAAHTMVYPPPTAPRPTAQRCDHDRPRAPCPRLACGRTRERNPRPLRVLRVKKAFLPARCVARRRPRQCAAAGTTHGWDVITACPEPLPHASRCTSTRRTFSPLLL